MIKENIDPLDNQLAELEQKIRMTRRLITRFRRAQSLDDEVAILAPESMDTFADVLAGRAASIQMAYQRVVKTYSETQVQAE